MYNVNMVTDQLGSPLNPLSSTDCFSIFQLMIWFYGSFSLISSAKEPCIFLVFLVEAKLNICLLVRNMTPSEC